MDEGSADRLGFVFSHFPDNDPNLLAITNEEIRRAFRYATEHSKEHALEGIFRSGLLTNIDFSHAIHILIQKQDLDKYRKFVGLIKKSIELRTPNDLGAVERELQNILQINTSLNPQEAPITAVEAAAKYRKGPVLNELFTVHKVTTITTTLKKLCKLQ